MINAKTARKLRQESSSFLFMKYVSMIDAEIEYAAQTGKNYSHITRKMLNELTYEIIQKIIAHYKLMGFEVSGSSECGLKITW